MPFDIAAAVFVDVITNDVVSRDSTSDTPVLHIINPVKIEWVQLLDLLESSGVLFERTTALQWIDLLQACTFKDPATEGLVSLWRNMVGIRALYVDNS